VSRTGLVASNDPLTLCDTRKEELPVNSGSHTVIYPVKDLVQSKALSGRCSDSRPVM
jgi:hypothetical protein